MSANIKNLEQKISLEYGVGNFITGKRDGDACAVVNQLTFRLLNQIRVNEIDNLLVCIILIYSTFGITFIFG